MVRIDTVVIQQRLAQQQPKPAMPEPAEPPSWSARPAPVSPLRTTPAPKARAATASAVTPAGTLRAPTTMRAALPLKATSAREERARANALRAQIDELRAALAVANAEAERALAREQVRADRLSDRVAALQHDLNAARDNAVVAERRADAADTDKRVAQARLKQAEAAMGVERARTDALSTTIDELRAGQGLLAETHTAELTAAQEAARKAEEQAEALWRAETERKARERWARLRDA